MKEDILNFRGRIIKNIFDSENYKVYAVIVNKIDYPDIKIGKYGNVSISGELPNLELDTEYEIEATEQETKYGIGYKVINIKREVPKTSEEMFCFLESILTKNQAETLWNVYPDIVDRVRNNNLDDINFDKLKGINEKRFESIKRKIIENFCLADLVIEFQGYFNLTTLKKIYEKYTSVEMVKEKLMKDPYKCLCGLAGIGFKTADALLLNLQEKANDDIKNNKKPAINFEYDLKTSPQRCLSCVLFLLQENETQGHTKMNLVTLREECIKFVPACANHFTTIIKDKNIYYNKDNMDVALKSTYDIEYKIADTIIHNIHNKENIWDFETEKYRVTNGFSLSDEQMSVLKMICENNIVILNGSGGTGKTSCTQAVINMLKENKKSFSLFAPTGKAAKVMSENTRERASTIHRGLGYIPPVWNYNEEHKLYSDIVIIDEFSMVDIFLFKRVIDAIDFKYTKLLLIGDNAQLTSVSCGNLLHDFMQSKIIPTVTLSKIFRYGEGGLMKVATDMRMGKAYLDKNMKGKMTSFGENKDYFFVDLPSEFVAKNAVELYKKVLSNGYSVDDVRVLTSKNVGDCGAIMLNHMLQKVANPNYGSLVNMQIGETTYYKNDLVMQKVNNYKAIEVDSNYEDIIINNDNSTVFVANGETGVIKEIFNTYVIIDFDGILVRYNKSDMLSIGLGYSITIHKSQGATIKAVILCTPQSHIFMLNSNLIYVGLTRMKEKCYHLGTLDSVNMATKKKANLTRHTFMQSLLSMMDDNGNKLKEGEKTNENKCIN